MHVYIGLLRGINVGTGRAVKMAELREMLSGLGLKRVATYVQSGNILFETERTDREALARSLESALAERYGFEIPVVLYLPAELQGIRAANPFSQPDQDGPHRLYYVLWKQKPGKELRAGLEAREFPEEAWSVGERCVYLYCRAGYGKAKLNNNLLERLGRMQATTRNDRTLRELLERSRQMTGD